MKMVNINNKTCLKDSQHPAILLDDYCCCQQAFPRLDIFNVRQCHRWMVEKGSSIWAEKKMGIIFIFAEEKSHHHGLFTLVRCCVSFFAHMSPTPTSSTIWYAFELSLWWIGTFRIAAYFVDCVDSVSRGGCLFFSSLWFTHIAFVILERIKFFPFFSASV